MAFIVFVIAWLIILVIFTSTGGEPEPGSLAQFLGWLCIGVVVLAALYTMFTTSFMGGVGMIGSLVFFSVNKDKKDE